MRSASGTHGSPIGATASMVRIGIGANVIILPGVSIGNGAVIGAGSIVTKDVPENVVAFGNPCKVVREISLLKDQTAHVKPGDVSFDVPEEADE